MKKWLLLLLPGILWVPEFLATAAPAATPAEIRGLEIAREADRRDSGWGDLQADMMMILRNRQGQTSTRYLRIRTLEVKGDGDKSLIVFDRPRDVKGTAFLSFTHATRPDDQWLYLPALKRVKRISSRNKSGPFMGSEFAYEDLSSQEVEKYHYRYLRDEPVAGHDCFVIERTPAYRHSGYTRQLVWLDKRLYQPRRIDYYDRKRSLLKTLTFRGYHVYLDRYWRADEMDMENHQSGKRTLLQWKHYRFRTGLSARDFDRNSLKRAH